MALDKACLSDILMQPMELFPISSCNSWALSGLPTLPSLQRMSIGAAGTHGDTWQNGPPLEWLAKIARPPTPAQELGGPKLPSLGAISEEAELPLSNQHEQLAPQIPSLFLQCLQQEQRQPALPQPAPQTSTPSAAAALTPHVSAGPALYAPNMPASAALTLSDFLRTGRMGGNPLLQSMQPPQAAQVPSSTWMAQQGVVTPRGPPAALGEGSPQGTPLTMPRVGSEAVTSPADSHEDYFHERAGSQEAEGKGAKGKRSKEEVQQRNKAAKLKEAEDAAAELALKLDIALEEKRQLELQIQEFTQTLAERDELIAQLRADKQAEPGKSAGRYNCGLTLTVYPQQQVVLTPQDVAELGRKDMVLLWKDYVSTLSGLLPSNQSAALNPAAADTVRRLAHEATALLLCVADSHPGMFKTLAACKLEPLSNEFGEDSVQVWAGITRLLALTPEQRQSLVQLRAVCLSTLGTIMDERNRIHAFLTEAMPAAVGARHAAAQYLKAHEGIEQLKINLKKEHDLKVDYMTAVWISVLTAEQVARAMVHAYPWLPDIMAVAAVVAAEEGDAEALSHLRADSSGGPGAFVQPLSHPQDNRDPVGSLAENIPITASTKSRSVERRSLVKTPFAASSPPTEGCIITSGRL
ncbi:g3122 [Coccomyxa viridis]|uniref:G3122 protein n=1 Tax=Coccomyxa viridis TaxID=1274662 RepID=A0ABP1FNN1_9CHLO